MPSRNATRKGLRMRRPHAATVVSSVALSIVLFVAISGSSYAAGSTERLTLRESRGASRQIAQRVAELFVNDAPKIRTRCKHIALTATRCPTTVRAKGLTLRYDLYVSILDADTLSVYVRRFRVATQPADPFP